MISLITLLTKKSDHNNEVNKTTTNKTPIVSKMRVEQGELKVYNNKKTPPPENRDYRSE